MKLRPETPKLGPLEQGIDDWRDSRIPIVPFKPRSKAPSEKGFLGYTSNPASRQRIEDWKAKIPDHNIAAVMGSEIADGWLIAAIDVDDDVWVNVVKALFPNFISAKRGKKGITIFVKVRTGPNLKSTSFQCVSVFGGVDFLSKGKCTIVPPSIHPETGKPYEWIGKPLYECSPDDLPECTKRHLDIIKATVTSAQSAIVIIGTGTHDAGLALTGELIRAGATDDEIKAIFASLLPTDYSGNSLEELPEWIESARRKGFDQPGGDTPPRDEYIARSVEEELGLIAYVEGHGFLHYEEGHWKRLPDNLIDQVSKRHIVAGGGKQYASSLLRPVRICLSLNVLRPKFGEHSGLICCLNGTLDVRTGELLEHSPDHELRYRLDIDYDPGAECPTYDKLINDTLMGNEACIRLFDEYAALTLIPELRFQVALYLLGEGGSGKSTLLRVVEMLHDPNAVSTTPLDKLDDERYRTDIADKLICISFDVQTLKKVFGETFTRITGGDPIAVRKLYQEVKGTVRSTVRFMGSMNPDTPGSISSPDALERRLLLVPCGPRVKSPDPDLFEKLKAEKAGILARYVKALQRLLKRNRFDIPDVVRDEVREYITYQDAFDVYAAERLRRGDIKTPVAEIAEDFNYWADRHGEKHLSNHVVGRKLKRLGFSRSQERRDTGQGSINTRVVNAEITVPRRSSGGYSF